MLIKPVNKIVIEPLSNLFWLCSSQSANKAEDADDNNSKHQFACLDLEDIIWVAVGNQFLIHSIFALFDSLSWGDEAWFTKSDDNRPNEQR